MSLHAYKSPFTSQNPPLKSGENLGFSVGLNFLISLDILGLGVAGNQLNDSLKSIPL
jgi:hypothetical protein